MSIIEERRELIKAEMEVGRGSAFVYDYPVSLEPPFKPFSFRPEKRSLFDSLFQHRDKAPQSLPDNSRRGRLNFIRIKPSREDKYSLDIAEQFILALPVSSPIAFEIIGQGGKIRFQIVSEENQTPAIISQVSSHFSGADVYPEGDLLRDVLSPRAVARAYRLKNTHFLPLNVNGSADPYRTLFGCLANLDRDMLGAFQVLFTPVTQNWPDNIYKASRNQYDPSQSPFFDIPKLPAIVDKKLSKILYAASIRMLASDEKLLVNMESFLKQADNGESGIIPVAGNYPVRSIIDRNTHVHGSILNSTELAYFLHLPAPEVIESAGNVEKAGKSYAVPDEYTSSGPVLGYNLYRGIKRTVCHTTHLPNQHVYSPGASGSGKSNSILNSAIQRIERGQGTAVIDPHGSLIRQGLLPRIPKARKDDVIYFNAGDFRHPMALNALANSGTKLEKEHIRVDSLNLFEDIFETALGVNIQHALNFIIITLLTRRDSTIQDIESLLLDKSWRAMFLQNVEDDRIQLFWELEYPALEKRGLVTAITNKLSPLILPDSTIAPMLSQRENKIDFLEIMNRQKIFLCNLSHGDIGKRNSQLLGKLIVSKIQIAAMMREGMDNYPDFYLYVDEFQHMSCPSMADILSGARKYRLHLWLANQMTEDIPDQILRNVFNAATMIFFATDSPHDRQLFEKTLLKKFTAEDIGQLKKGEALVKMAGSIFNMKTERVPDPPQVHWADEIISQSRMRYTAARPNETKKKDRKPLILSQPEKAFLESVFQNPTLSVTALYKYVGLSAYMGDKLKNTLKDRGLLKEISTHSGLKSRIAKFLLLTPESFNALDMELGPESGKGGQLHRYWQSVIKYYAENNGYRVVVEEVFADSKETVDLGLERDGNRTAIEISIITDAENEVSNIKKCLKAGYDKIIVLALEEGKVKSLEALAKKTFTAGELSKISFGLTYGFGGFC